MSTKAASSVAGAIVALLFSSTDVEAGDPVRGERLFRITRNKNDNIVCYDVLQKNGKLDKDNPVSVYWIIPSENNKLEELNWLERKKAYGIELIKAFGQDSVDIRLKAGKKALRVTKRDVRWVTVTTVDSREVAVDSVYVMATESGATPTVQWVDVVGRFTATGESAWKRMTK